MAKIKKKHLGYIIPTILLLAGALFLYLKTSGAVGGGLSGGFKSQGYFQGGSAAEDLNIKSIRWHKHNGYERIVLDIYKWNGVFSERPYKKAHETGVYQIGRELTTDTTIDGEISGYRAFSANMPHFSKSASIKRMELFSNDDNSYIFSLILKHPASYKVFTLKNPARIVIDIK
jgi:hypothetical protein